MASKRWASRPVTGPRGTSQTSNRAKGAAMSAGSQSRWPTGGSACPLVTRASGGGLRRHRSGNPPTPSPPCTRLGEQSSRTAGASIVGLSADRPAKAFIRGASGGGSQFHVHSGNLAKQPPSTTPRRLARSGGSFTKPQDWKGSRFKVQGSRFKVQGQGSRSRFKVQGPRFRFGVQGSGFEWARLAASSRTELAERRS